MSIGLAYLYDFTRQNLDDHYVTNGEWNETKYNQYMLARALLPGYSSYADYEIGKKNNEVYMKRYGLTWSEVMNPWKLPGYGLQQGAVEKTLNYVSHNLNKLYRD